ncbi:hypothetical protein BDU57DRAFT_515872 [Ampelomyces quisqualis]|uniref:Uncharacterized protein n=1 Tax=Ampelomyces quisqualis TaxID=50730 RepID=A0A6A5QKS3_AMPQU|nr:hypothetical protein BDU57DRAFT_515872 [Ampelomyces quisqualis]
MDLKNRDAAHRGYFFTLTTCLPFANTMMMSSGRMVEKELCGCQTVSHVRDSGELTLPSNPMVLHAQSSGCAG